MDKRDERKRMTKRKTRLDRKICMPPLHHRDFCMNVLRMVSGTSPTARYSCRGINIINKQIILLDLLLKCYIEIQRRL